MAARRHRAVILAGCIIDTAHNGLHGTIGCHRYQCALAKRTLFALFPHNFFDEKFGLFLQLPIDRGVDNHILFYLTEIVVHQGFHPVGHIVFCACNAGANALIGVDRCGFCLASEM